MHPLHMGRMGFPAFCEKVKKPSTFISAGMHQQAPLPHDTETRAAGPTLPSPQALPKYYVPPRLNGVRVLPYLTLQSEILSAFPETPLLWNSPSSPLCLSLQQMRSCRRVRPWVPSPCCYTCQMAATAQQQLAGRLGANSSASKDQNFILLFFLNTHQFYSCLSLNLPILVEKSSCNSLQISVHPINHKLA